MPLRRPMTEHWPDAAARAFDFVVLRGSTFAAFQARNIATSLRNLQRSLETQSSG